MSFSRRKFVIGAAGASVAVVVAANTATVLSSGGAPASDHIVDVVATRFPYISKTDPALQEFARDMVLRDFKEKGSTEMTKEDAVRGEAIDMQRYIAAEFAASTNALNVGAKTDKQLTYHKRVRLDHSKSRFNRSPAAAALKSQVL